MQESKPPKNIQSVHRALDILEFLLTSGDGKKLSEIADACNLNKTTAFHIIKTLEARGYLEQSPDSLKYKYSGAMFQMATQVYQNINLLSVCAACMEELASTCHETVGLYNYSKINGMTQALCLQYIESPNPVKVALSVGKWFPLTSTAVGRMYLSMLDDHILHDELQKSGIFEEEKVSNIRELLAEVRKQHYCIEYGEFEEGVTNIAFPIYKWSGRVIASICVSIPTQRVTDQLLSLITEKMLPYSRQLSAVNL